jgi:hypothetical protein
MTLSCPKTPALLGAPYVSQLVVGAGTAPFAYQITAGALPGGLGLNPTTGLISGVPTVAGSFAFTAQVTDSLSAVATVSCSIAVHADVLTLTFKGEKVVPE